MLLCSFIFLSLHRCNDINFKVSDWNLCRSSCSIKTSCNWLVFPNYIRKHTTYKNEIQLQNNTDTTPILKWKTKEWGKFQPILDVIII